MPRIRRFEEKSAEPFGLGMIDGFLHDQRRRLSMSSKFNDFSVWGKRNAACSTIKSRYTARTVICFENAPDHFSRFQPPAYRASVIGIHFVTIEQACRREGVSQAALPDDLRRAIS